ncbi:hypothetical protein Tco_0232249 [Tanacetum coccineum]
MSVSLDTSLYKVSKSWSLSRKVGCVETKITTWDDLAFKLIIRNEYCEKDKDKAKTGQNQARDWKEHEKSKSKTYSS